MAHKQSPAYPNFPLKKAIDLTAQIFENDRKNPIDRDVAAKHIGYSGLSGPASKSLATLAHYRLVEKAGKGQLRVTQTLVDILYPDSQDDRRAALKEAGLSPAIFEHIHERFPDGTPSESALKAWLMREEFLDRAINPVTKAFLETMHYLEQEKVFDSGGNEADDAPYSVSQSATMEQNQMDIANEQVQQTSPVVVTAELNRINAQITGDTVHVSALLDKDGLVKLEKKIAALKAFLDDD